MIPPSVKKKSIMLKLVTLLVVVIMVPTAALSLISIWIVFNRLENDLLEAVAQASNNARTLLVEQLEKAENIAKLIADSNEVKLFTNLQELQEYLDGKHEIWFSAIIEVYDKERNIFIRSYARGEDNEHFFSPSDDPILSRTLNFEKYSDYIRTPRGIVIKASWPVVDYTTLETKGAVIITYPLDIELLKKIKKWVQADVTMEWDDGAKQMSTIHDDNNLSRKPVWDKPYSHFETTLQSPVKRFEKIGGSVFAVSHSPLKDRQGRIMATLTTAVNTASIDQNKNDTLKMIFFSSMGIFIFAVLIGVLTARTFIYPIRRLVEAIRSMAGGNLDVQVHLAQNDEIGELAQAFNELGEKLLTNIEQKIEANNANKAKNEFLTNISHEIRTPLNAIMGFAELALKSAVDIKQKNYLEKIWSSGQSLLRIVNDIFDYSRIEAGKLHLERRRFELSKVMKSLCETFSCEAERKNIDMDVTIDEAIPAVLLGDAIRLEQILVNLIANAIKFTQEGTVSVHVARKSEDAAGVSLEFSVSDTGIGIDPCHLPKILESFTQMDGSTTRNYGGIGLGLTISCQLVKMMDGELWVESKTGEGTTFYFKASFKKPDSLIESGNLSDNSHAEGDSKGAEADPTTTIQGAKVLLVEDNSINQQVAAEILENAGVWVEIANNGKEAVDAVIRERYDAVLMDIQMPVMDGLQATRKIRERCGFHTLPIIAMTAHALKKDRERCLDAGMNDYLTKPIDTPALMASLSRWIDSERFQKSFESTYHRQLEFMGFPEELPGIDIDAGLKRLNGNRKLFTKLIREFSMEFSQAKEDIEKELKAGRYQNAARIIHTIKGVAGNIAAMELHRAVLSYETAIKNQADDHHREPLKAMFEKALNRVMESAHVLETAQPFSPCRSIGERGERIEPEELSKPMKELFRLLSQNNPKAEDCLKTMKADLLQAGYEKKIEMLENHLHRFDFKNAQKTLNDIADGLGIMLDG